VNDQVPRPAIIRAVVLTWLVTAAWDLVCASALSVFAYKGTFARLWQGVGSTAFGPDVLQMGNRGVLIGISVHLAVALTWSLIFVIALVLSTALRRVVSTTGVAILVACIYGPIIWLVMSLVVIRLATGRSPTFGFRWWVQIFAHVPFVTLPLVFTARRALGLDRRPVSP
jgi:hypothetical protein